MAKAGRKPQGQETKKHKTLRLEPQYIEFVENNFSNFSKGIQFLIEDFMKKNKIRTANLEPFQHR